MSAVLALGFWCARPAATQATQTTGEVRGLWVLRSTLATPRGIQQMVETAQRGGFNTLLVQVRGRGDAYYNSRVEPRAAELDDAPATFDPLAATLAAAHAAGLKVHAWFNVDLVSSATVLPRSRAHIVARHPEWLMVPRRAANALRVVPTDIPIYVGEIARAARADSEHVEGLYLSPVLPASRDYTASVVTDLVSRYALDGIHLDYLRYPTDQFDYSTSSLAAFRAEAAPSVSVEQRDRLDKAARTNVAAWPDALPDAWSTFRQSRLTALAASLRAAAVKARPGIVVSAAVAPNADEARAQRLQDWRLWARQGLIDVLCPMIYTTDATEFSAALTRVKADAGRAAVWAGVGAWKLTPERAAENVKTARRANIAGVLLYSYDSLSSADAAPNYFSLLRPALLDELFTPIGR